MRMRSLVAGLVVAGAAPLLAQGGGLSSSQCPNSTLSQHAAQDACQQAYDVYQYMAPQLGLALAGGNAVLGQGGTLGGLGHFSIGVRGNVFQGQLPDVGNFPPASTSGAQQRQLPSKSQWLGLPTADAEVGIWKGIPLGVTNILGIDALVSASYVPKIDNSSGNGGLTVTPQSSLQLGYGARVGLLQESIIVPGVSFTFLKRDLPKTDLVGSANAMTFRIDTMQVKTTAWRLVASKSLLLFSLAAGVGQDKYDQSASISATTSGIIGGTASVPNTSQSLTRTNMFADLQMNFVIFKLVAEAGRSSGGTVSTYNSFSGGDAARAQNYFSAGLRFGF